MSTTHGRLSRQAAIRLQGGELILRGFDNDEIVDILDVSRSSVERWRKKIESEGLRGLARKAGSGRSSELSPEQLQELKAVVGQGAKSSGYLTDRWTSRIVADLIRKKWGVGYSRSNVRKILSNLGLSYHKPDVKSTKFSQQAVDDWRRLIWPRIKKKRTTRV